MIKGLLILFGFLWLGEQIDFWLGLNIPGSVIGMVLLTISLSIGIIKLEWVKDTADLLINNMAFLFVPPGVGIMLYFNLINAEWLPILISLVASTFIVMALTALIQQWVGKNE